MSIGNNGEGKITCPKGHVMNVASLKCVVSLLDDDIDKAVIFLCDGGKGHSFSLKTAMRAKMFTPEQADRLRKQAEEHRKKYGYKVE